MDETTVQAIVAEAIEQHVQDKHKRKKRKDVTLEGFELFYSIWTRKKAKGVAERAWKKINPGPLLTQEIITAARAQVEVFEAEWKRTNRQYQKYPASWLNGKCWLDEIESGKKPKLVKPKVLCACGCGHEAHRKHNGRMWYLTDCWWDKTKQNSPVPQMEKLSESLTLTGQPLEFDPNDPEFTVEND